MKLDVLAVGAHPDDIELSCSGTILNLVRQGKKVGILDLTEGELGTRGTVALRKKESDEATKILGVQVRENMSLPDGGIEINHHTRCQLIQIIRKYQPTLMLIPHWLERHPDHEHAHQLCREAWFYSGLEKIETTFERKKQKAFRPKGYFHFMQTYEFIPSFVVDISDTYDQRMEAVRAFRSQFYDPNSKEAETFLSTPDFMEFLEARFAYYGDRIGRKYGEPFYSITMIGVTDPFHITL